MSRLAERAQEIPSESKFHIGIEKLFLYPLKTFSEKELEDAVKLFKLLLSWERSAPQAVTLELEIS